MTGAHRRDRDVKAALAGNGERGVALILSLLVLVVISLVAVILMSTLKTDNQVVSRSGGHSQALSYAEAGVEEALARIREGDIATNGANPRMVSQIFLASAGGVPLLGSDSIALATMQPRDHWLEYSKPTKDADVLTVEYKTNADRTQIYRYDPTLASPVQTSSGVPIFTITSTGTLGTDRRRVTADVFAKPIVSSVYAALSTDVPIHLSRNFEVCGFNHRLDTASEARRRLRARDSTWGAETLRPSGAARASRARRTSAASRTMRRTRAASTLVRGKR
jgi:Tfp pilus assembly protein PilX